MLNRLKQKNPELEISDVRSPAFSTYGRIIEGSDPSEIIAKAQEIKNSGSGSNYQAGVKTFEALAIAKEMERRFFGERKIQVGYCWGNNRLFQATEWHTCNEINIAVTDLVIFVGHLWDIKNNTVDTSAFQAFYVPAGTVLECYATTLHYGPCEVQKDGFGWIVALPEGTNTPLDGTYTDPLLWAKNKWLLAHIDNTELIEQGAIGGVTGINWEIFY